MAGKNILLIEPSYKNKYPPLGLMKIAQYHGPNGKGDHVRFIKGEERSVLSQAWDRIYITTLFSFEFSKIAQSIDFAKRVAGGQTDKIFVGGIAASLDREMVAVPWSRFWDRPGLCRLLRAARARLGAIRHAVGLLTSDRREQRCLQRAEPLSQDRVYQQEKFGVG